MFPALASGSFDASATLGLVGDQLTLWYQERLIQAQGLRKEPGIALQVENISPFASPIFLNFMTR